MAKVVNLAVRMERTFAIIKPDAMRNGKSEAIMRDVQDAGMFQFREDFV